MRRTSQCHNTFIWRQLLIDHGFPPGVHTNFSSNSSLPTTSLLSDEVLLAISGTERPKPAQTPRKDIRCRLRAVVLLPTTVAPPLIPVDGREGHLDAGSHSYGHHCSHLADRRQCSHRADQPIMPPEPPPGVHHHIPYRWDLGLLGRATLPDPAHTCTRAARP